MARIWCSNIINTMTIFGVQMGSPFHSAGADDFVFWFFFFTQNRQFCNLGKYELLSVLLPSFGCKVKVAQSCPTLRPHGLCPWNSPGQNTGVGHLSLLQGIFPTQGLNLGLHTAGRFFTIWIPGVQRGGHNWALGGYKECISVLQSPRSRLC